MKTLATTLIIGALSMNSYAAYKLPVLEKKTIDITHKSFEPSGIAINQDTRTIYVISDDGTLCTLADNKLSCTIQDKLDYEGLTLTSEYPDLLFAIEEGKDNLHTIKTSGEKVSSINIQRRLDGRLMFDKKGNGLEALAFFKKDRGFNYFFAANQSDKFEGHDSSGILMFSVRDDKLMNAGKRDRAELVLFNKLKIKDISGLTFHNGYLFAISDTENTLFVFNEKLALIQKFDLPGKDQEGIAFLDDTLYIVQDSGNMFSFKLDLKEFPYLLVK